MNLSTELCIWYSDTRNRADFAERRANIRCFYNTLAGAIIASDVAHNSWILRHFGMAPDATYWAQLAFLLFLLAPIRMAWRGVVPDEQKPDLPPRPVPPDGAWLS